MTSSDADRPTVRKPTARQRFWAEVRGYAEALIIAYLVVTFVFNTVGVVGSSMRPNLDGGVGSSNVFQSLLTGDRVFIPKYDTWLRRARVLGEYRRGEIVVVREPANAPIHQIEGGRRPFFIKRVVARPGDTLQIAAGQVIVNGVPVDQGFISASGEITPDREDFPLIVQQGGEATGLVVQFQRLGNAAIPRLPRRGFYPPAVELDDPRVQLYYGTVVANLAPIPADAPEGEPFLHTMVIPDGHYFVMGDNRQSSAGGSEDSRFFGPIRGITIAGRATAVIWPPRRDGTWNWRSLTPPAAFDAVPDTPDGAALPPATESVAAIR